MSARHEILLVAAEPAVRTALSRAMAQAGGNVHDAASRSEAEAAVADGSLDVVVADLSGDERELVDLLHVLRERAPDLPVVVTRTAGARMPAGELLRLGAHEVRSREDESEALAGAVDLVLHGADATTLDDVRLQAELKAYEAINVRIKGKVAFVEAEEVFERVEVTKRHASERSLRELLAWASVH